MQAYHEIETRLVTETVFSQYMYKTLPTSNHLWAFKKQFCTQMALSGAAQHPCNCHWYQVCRTLTYPIQKKVELLHGQGTVRCCVSLFFPEGPTW